MKLRMVTLAAPGAHDKDVGGDAQTVIGSFEWVMPGDPAAPLTAGKPLANYAREDMAFVRYLASAAFVERPADPSATTIAIPGDCNKTPEPFGGAANDNRLAFDRAIDEELCSLAQEVNAGLVSIAGSAAFNTRVAQGVVGPILQSLTLSTPLAPNGPKGTQPGPFDLREWFCEGPLTDYTGGVSRRLSQTLRVVLPTLRRQEGGLGDVQVWRSYHITGVDSWHYSGEPGHGGYEPGLGGVPVSGQASEWFPRSGASEVRRTNVSVGLPLSIKDGPTLPDAPPCASMASVEAALRRHAGESAHEGSEHLPTIVGFLRRDVFASPGALGVDVDEERRAYSNSTRSNTGYVRFRFRSAGQRDAQDSVMIDDDLPEAKTTKDRILVAPGDILILNQELLSVPSRLD